MTSTPRPERAEIEAALLLLAKLGITPADLIAGPPVERTPVPTFAEFIPEVSDAVPDSTRSVYGTYWNRIVEHWGTRRLDQPTPLELEQLGERLRSNRIQRRNDRGGCGTVENYIAAMRCLYKRAVTNGLIAEAENPARKVAKPTRSNCNRHALPAKRLAEIHQVVATTGDDPALDTLLLRIHTETACRRGGALDLRPMDLDPEQCLIRLREKFGTHRWQPVSPSLMRHLQDHAALHRTPPTDQLLRYKNGKEITHRRYDYLWERVGQHLNWVAVQGVSAHWLRHTILTWVERNFGYAISTAYAGHKDSSRAGSTATYVRADIHELAAVLSALTGEPHPLAAREGESETA